MTTSVAIKKNLQTSLLNAILIEEERFAIQENTVAYDEPLIRFVDHLIQHALQESASDIHIEPYEQICRIRYRQDGLLYEMAEIPINLVARLVTRLKVMAKLDISERRLPQDGRLQIQKEKNRAIDIRINTCPTLFGEKIVLRILDANKIALDIHSLGMSETQKNLFLEKISAPQGMILVTGPTGSGKTVTLYSALHFLNTSEKNISTVEDPVEIQLNGINQVNINPKIGLHFSTILRNFLRQDPDIIMIGEIRDTETADIAIQAAQTGHLVLSTLHANSAIETITRLQSMGGTTYNLTSSISLIVAQRLIRKLCDHCKMPHTLTAKKLIELGFKETDFILYRAKGCEHCQQGYQGRIGIYEMLSITESITHAILSGTTIFKENFLSLREMGLEKIRQGITSLAEINRVIQK